VFLVEDPTVTHHRVYLAREHRADEPTGPSWRETEGEQTIEGGANLWWSSAPQLQRNQLPHSPFVAKPAIESQRSLVVVGWDDYSTAYCLANFR
jgi:hypothetical protein